MKTKIKDKSKMQAGFARAEKYHERNCQEIIALVQNQFPANKARMVNHIVKETYALFRIKFRFFKK